MHSWYLRSHIYTCTCVNHIGWNVVREAECKSPGAHVTVGGGVHSYIHTGILASVSIHHRLACLLARILPCLFYVCMRFSARARAWVRACIHNAFVHACIHAQTHMYVCAWIHESRCGCSRASTRRLLPRRLPTGWHAVVATQMVVSSCPVKVRVSWICKYEMKQSIPEFYLQTDSAFQN